GAERDVGKKGGVALRRGPSTGGRRRPAGELASRGSSSLPGVMFSPDVNDSCSPVEGPSVETFEVDAPSGSDEGQVDSPDCFDFRLLNLSPSGSSKTLMPKN